MHSEKLGVRQKIWIYLNDGYLCPSNNHLLQRVAIGQP
jgi:hypothetical protein